jgi:hypothetical protein
MRTFYGLQFLKEFANTMMFAREPLYIHPPTPDGKTCKYTPRAFKRIFDSRVATFFWQKFAVAYEVTLIAS